MSGSELRRELFELVYYPPHDPRERSAAYRKLHEELIVARDEPCWICGARHSTGGEMETHHSIIEWAAANGVSIDLVMHDFPSVHDAPTLRRWLDSEGNMLVLCAGHHRHPLVGIHSITYPAWVLQRYSAVDGWRFLPGVQTDRERDG